MLNRSVVGRYAINDTWAEPLGIALGAVFGPLAAWPWLVAPISDTAKRALAKDLATRPGWVLVSSRHFVTSRWLQVEIRTLWPWQLPLHAELDSKHLKRIAMSLCCRHSCLQDMKTSFVKLTARFTLLASARASEPHARACNPWP